MSLLSFTAAAQDFAAAEKLLSGAVERKELAGAIALVARNGEIVHLRSYGYMDAEQGTPMDENAIVPIASMTKITTSAGILMLQEERRLDIDDPVEKHLSQFRSLKVYTTPEGPETETPVVRPTIRHLLSHTAGLTYSWGNTLTDRQYTDAGFRAWNKPLQEFADGIAAIPLAFQPGTAWDYSYAHDVLGYLIEKVSGMPLDRFLRERLFDPLGMNDTDFYVPEEKADRLSDLYTCEEGRLRKVDSAHNSVYRRLPTALSGGGGWFDAFGGAVSTVGDYYKLAHWLLGCGTSAPGILTPESIRAMISNQIGELHVSGGDKYGLGVGIVPGEHGETKEIYWAGSPYNTYFWIDYENREVGILFTNTGPFGHLDIMNAFRAACRTR